MPCIIIDLMNALPEAWWFEYNWLYIGFELFSLYHTFYITHIPVDYLMDDDRMLRMCFQMFLEHLFVV